MQTRTEIARSTQFFSGLLEAGNSPFARSTHASRRKDASPTVEYLRRVKDKKLPIEHSDPSTHFSLFGQLASQELFAWAVRVTWEAYRAVIRSQPERQPLLKSFLAGFANFAPN
jgi:hypothetical protein